MQRFLSDGDWGLVPGPIEFAEPLFSMDLVAPMPEYSPQRVTSSLLALAGVRLNHSAEPSWWEWRACWEGQSGLIEFGMTLFEPIDAEASFGGFDLQADCDAADLLKLWEALRVTTPGLWLHSPDCELIKPEQFAKRYAA